MKKKSWHALFEWVGEKAHQFVNTNWPRAKQEDPDLAAAKQEIEQLSSRLTSLEDELTKSSFAIQSLGNELATSQDKIEVSQEELAISQENLIERTEAVGNLLEMNGDLSELNEALSDTHQKQEAVITDLTEEVQELKQQREEEMEALFEFRNIVIEYLVARQPRLVGWKRSWKVTRRFNKILREKLDISKEELKNQEQEKNPQQVYETFLGKYPLTS